MQEAFDGELPPDVISEYPAEEVEELGIIDLGRGVSPTHIHSHHYHLRSLLQKVFGLLAIMTALTVVWWTFKPVLYCLLAIAGLIISLIVIDAYVARWRVNQERQEQSSYDELWWLK